jgi:methylase of polypeptide subunit release factors
VLPDASRLSSWPAERWRAVGARLREMGLVGSHAAVAAIGGENAFEPSVRPLRAWHLRRRRDPASYAMRALMYADPITETEARTAFGALDVDDLLSVGLLERAGDPDRVVSPFVFRFADDAFFFGDDLRHGGDAVMTFGRMTVSLARAAMPAQPLGRILDLGCGAGACALLLASNAERVVATDINPRALLLAGANVAMNDVHNVELRCGDLYAPVAGEEFDLIVSQPPFVPKPDGREHATYMFGGRRGDELPLRALAEAPAHLRPGGHAAMIVQWPVFDEPEDVAARVRRAVPGAEIDVLLLDAPGADVDEYCIADAVLDHPDFGPEYERVVLEHREHAERIGLRAVRDTLTILARRTSGSAFTATFETPDLLSLKLRGEQVRDLVAAHALAAGDETELLASRLRLPPGTAFERSATGCRLRYPEGYLLDGVELDERAEAILRLLQESPNVRDAVRRFAKKARSPYERALEELAPAVRRILTMGILPPPRA